MKKRLFNLILALVMIVCVLPFAASAACEECDYSILMSTDVPPTCHQEGVGRYRCSVCGRQTTNKPIPKLEHEPEVLPAVEATCTKTGLTEGSKCTLCGDILTKQVVTPKVAHDYKFYSVDKKATCHEEGVDRYKCANCPIQKTVATPKLEHVGEEIPAVAATCTATGLTAGEKCSLCGDILTKQVVTAKVPHNHTIFWGYEGMKAPTCTEGAVEVWICEICNKNQKHTPVAELGHDMVVLDLYREPTCEQVGCAKYKCQREGCGLVTILEIDALGHKEETLAAVAPTCEAEGLTEGKKCTVCGKVTVAQEVIPVQEHDWEDVAAKEKTCTEDGYSAHQQCKNCQATQNKEVYPAGHNYVNFKCTVCGARDVNCEHENAKITVKDSTCVVAGSKTFACPDCGYEFVEALPLAEHQEIDKSVAATCTDKGLNHQVCKICNEDLVKEEIPVIPHNFVDGICSMCGAPECSHGSTRTETVPSSCCINGTRKVICNDCGKTVSSEYLPLAAHNFVSGFCSNCGAIDRNRLTNDLQDVFLTGDK